MLMPFLAVVAGLILLAWSAGRFVDGAAAASHHLGVSPLLIGMLVIGFGTSAPELLVSALAAAQGNPGLALGNAYGSNIANIGLILGLVSLISPLAVHSRLLRQELPLLGLATLLAAWQLRDGVLGLEEALVSLAALAVIMGISVWRGRESNPGAMPLSGEIPESQSIRTMPLAAALVWTVVGLALLIASSRMLVWGAVAIAENFGVSDLIIGLTVVAVGTSLPELASSLSAVRRLQPDLVLGNVVGSNLFNTLGVVGLAGVITPIDAGPEVLARDWPVMATMTLLMAFFAVGWKRRPGRINRLEGGLLLALFVGYTVYLISTMMQAQGI